MSEDNGIGYYFDNISKIPAFTREEEAELYGAIQRARKRIAQTIGSKASLERLRQITFDADNDDKLDNEETLLIIQCVDDPVPESIERLRNYFMTADYDILKQYCGNLPSLNRQLAIIKDTRDRLIQSNLKWTVAIAKRYTRHGHSMGFLDLIQEGNIGLMRAVDKFDPNRGRLSTVATHWIRQAIIRAMSNKARQIRIPVHLIDSFNRAYRSLSRDGLPLTPEGVFERIDVPNITLFRVHEIMAIMNGPVEVGGDDEADHDFNEDECSVGLEGSIADERALPDQQIGDDRLSGTINRIIRQLPPREEKVLRLTLGL